MATLGTIEVGMSLMEQLATLFDAFYSRFVLRDLLAKIAPGAIFLIALSAIVTDSAESIADHLANLSFWAWIILISVSWITGIAIQGIGEKLHLIIYYPEWKDPDKKEKLDRGAWYKMDIEFSEKASESEKQQVERFVVIKEACGNAYIALSISVILLTLNGLINLLLCRNDLYLWLREVILPLSPVIAITLTFIFFLRYMHYEHVQRQYDYLSQCLKARKR